MTVTLNVFVMYDPPFSTMEGRGAPPAISAANAVPETYYWANVVVRIP